MLSESRTPDSGTQVLRTCIPNQRSYDGRRWSIYAHTMPCLSPLNRITQPEISANHHLRTGMRRAHGRVEDNAPFLTSQSCSPAYGVTAETNGCLCPASDRDIAGGD